MMTRWAPIPNRQPGEALTDISYRAEMEDNRQTGRVVAEFRHRDGRIWQGRIMPLPPGSVQTHITGHTHTIALSSGGCRQFRFIANGLSSAKRTVLRFANLPLDVYDRLIADARGTTDHPRPDDVGVFRIQVVKRHRRPGGRTETQRYEREGIGRLEGSIITVFPHSEELQDILGLCCSGSSLPVVPSGINELNPVGFSRTELDEATVGQVDEDAVDAAVLRGFDDDLVTALAGLEDGSYTIPRPREREDRAIDIFGDQDAEPTTPG